MPETTKYTPKPWRWMGREALVGDHGRRPCVLTATTRGRLGAELMERGEDGLLHPLNPEGPNALLLAAAPDMYEALEAADRILWMAEKYAEGGGSGGPEQRDYDEAAPLIKAALAKAEGRS